MFFFHPPFPRILMTSSYPYSAGASQPRTVPGRAAAPSHTHSQSWSETLKQVAFRPGHSYSASSTNLVISAPLAFNGEPIVAPPSGATIVRTPQDALRSHRGESPGRSPPRLAGPSVLTINEPTDNDMPPTPPAKPFVSPLAIRTRSPHRDTPQKPMVLPPAPPSPTSSQISPIALVSPPPPPFKPIILSKVPIRVSDVSQVLVKLETESKCFTSTFATLTSRTSMIASLLYELVDQGREVRQSTYSADSKSPLGSLFLDSSPCPSGDRVLHIFLDRPSEP